MRSRFDEDRLDIIRGHKLPAFQIGMGFTSGQQGDAGAAVGSDAGGGTGPRHLLDRRAAGARSR